VTSSLDSSADQHIWVSHVVKVRHLDTSKRTIDHTKQD